MQTQGIESQHREARQSRMVDYGSYRKLGTLSTGKRVVFRLLNGKDRKGLVEFLGRVRDQDVQFCKIDIKSEEVLDDWLSPEKSPNIISLVAADPATNQIIAILNLCRGQQSAQKVGEIHHVIVAKSLQGMGLGSMMLDESITLASRQGLHWLKAEIAVESEIILKAFQSRGFQIKTILEDYFIDYYGETHDAALMMLPLIKDNNDDF